MRVQVYGQAAVKLKEKCAGWHERCDVGIQDDTHSSHLSHFDANGVLRIASNSAGCRRLLVTGLGNQACR